MMDSDGDSMDEVTFKSRFQTKNSESKRLKKGPSKHRRGTTEQVGMTAHSRTRLFSEKIQTQQFQNTETKRNRCKSLAARRFSTLRNSLRMAMFNGH